METLVGMSHDIGRMSKDAGDSKAPSGNIAAAASSLAGSLDPLTDGNYPSCSAIFDRMWHCGNPSGQLSNAWKYGDIENCAPWMSDWNDCMKAKISSDEEYKERVLSNMNCMRRKRSGASHDIWELKHKPDWSFPLNPPGAKDK